MNIRVNGEEREVEDGLTVAMLLESLGFQAKGTVVERNGEILDRTAYDGTALQAGDALELVRFVGGG